ncbi:hypothetical protein G7Y89_g9571 [Cudoniella acicularis]|uniref:Major facilitator superfamily (MFS) profile domain-containing protein n=1 Tax=Cudoniella acicularis TaxID=354080 RepID=A0A8H4REE4_9HELO|nr:hypothetical protein G7Y89_g9571 [Cudoniella acicularis]
MRITMSVSSSKWLLVYFLQLFASMSQATTISVSLGGQAGLIFNPNNITGVGVGDVIEFSFFGLNHSVVQSSFEDPCHPLVGGFFSGFQSTNSEELSSISENIFSIVINDTNPIWMFCGQFGHCQKAMVAAINAPSTGSTIAAFEALARNTTMDLSTTRQLVNRPPVGGTLVSVKGNAGLLEGTTNVSTPSSTMTSSISTSTLSTATPSSSTPINTNPPGANSTQSHTTLVGVAVSLIVICLVAGLCFWLYAQHTRKSQKTKKYQDRFNKAELDAHEAANHRSLRAELSSNNQRIPEFRIALFACSISILSESKALIAAAAPSASIHVYSADVTNHANLSAALGKAIGEVGTLEVVVYNTARVNYDMFGEYKEDILTDFKIRCLGLYTIAKTLLPHLQALAREKPEAHLCLFVTSSPIIHKPFALVFSLSMTKAAQASLVTLLAEQNKDIVHVALVGVLGLAPINMALEEEHSTVLAIYFIFLMANCQARIALAKRLKLVPALELQMTYPKTPLNNAERLKDNPIDTIELPDLRRYIDALYEAEFNNKDCITPEELWTGAKLARSYGYRTKPDEEEPTDEETDDDIPSQGSANASVTSASAILKEPEWKAIKIQQSLAFWREPKDLLVACCVASLTQGWDQVANGNLGWPGTFGLVISPDGTGNDIWRFGAVNAITWFSAALLGPCLVDPICHSKFFGRRGAVFIAASFSFASMIGGSQAQSWQGYLISRLFLGIGIGAKASIIPIWESEILPPAKRGRLLVSWQVFVATGIFAGSVATYIFRDNWRNQVLTGALPALILLILAFLCCESPRWLILQGKYVKAFETLVRLRKERILAAEELCYIHFQIETERALLRGHRPNYDNREPRIPYGDRLPRLLTITRNRRAAIVSMIVMISQQLSGINILAFLASAFFSTADLRNQVVDPSNPGASNIANEYDSLRLAIGFGAANAIFSTFAYFLIEPLESEDALLTNYSPSAGQNSNQKRKRSLLPPWMHGRRSLMLLSLAGGTVMLFILTFLLDLKKENSAKLPSVMVFIMLFTLCYSPGAGCVPFLYSAEVWPNEGREIGMSWAVFWNFLGAGFLALLRPPGFPMGRLQALRPLHAGSLEDMSAKFDKSLIGYGKEKLDGLIPRKSSRSAGPNAGAEAGAGAGEEVVAPEKVPDVTGEDAPVPVPVPDPAPSPAPGPGGANGPEGEGVGETVSGSGAKEGAGGASA